MSMETDRTRIEREQWDRRAVEYAEAVGEDLRVGAFHHDLTSHVRKTLDLLGDVSGKTILDCGCGSGVTTVWLAKRGADVYSFDVSGELVELTRRRAETNGVQDRIHLGQMQFEHMDYPDGFFDLAFGNMILHHVDCDAAGKELSRVLKPGGRAVFAETSGRNRLLMFARRHLAGRYGIDKYSTEGEKPLEPPELDALGKHFSRMTVHHLEFLFFTTACSNVLKWRDSTKWLQKILFGTDSFVYRRIPFLRKYSYLMAVELVK